MRHLRLVILSSVILGFTVTGTLAQSTGTGGQISEGPTQAERQAVSTNEAQRGDAFVRGQAGVAPPASPIIRQVDGEDVGAGGGAWGAGISRGAAGMMSRGAAGMMSGRRTGSQFGQSTRPVASIETPHPRIIVVPTSQINLDAFTAISDDLQVMLHILRKNLTKGRTFVAEVFPDYGDLLGRDRACLEGLYVQGYGVFLFTEVELAQPVAAEEQTVQEQGKDSPADPVWERARQELGPGSAGAPVGTPYSYGTLDAAGYAGRALQMNAPQADGWESEELLKELIQVFKHASNIRHLDPNESITLSVLGRTAGQASYSYGQPSYSYYRVTTTSTPLAPPPSSSGADPTSAPLHSGPSSPGVARYYSYYKEPGSGPAGPGKGPTRATQPEPQEQPLAGGDSTVTMFTLQARKSDIDAFARGQMPLDQFRQKVRVLTY